MGKSGDDEAPGLITKVGSLCEGKNGGSGQGSIMGGNGVFLRHKRRGSESGSEVVGQLKRRGKSAKDVSLSSLESASVVEQEKDLSCGPTKLDKVSAGAERARILNGPASNRKDGKEVNGAEHSSGEKWVVKKKDRSRQVTSNSELSSHSGNGLEVLRRSRGASRHKKSDRSAQLQKGGEQPHESAVLVSELVGKVEASENEELSLIKGKKRFLAEDEKHIDARSSPQRKRQRRQQKGEETHFVVDSQLKEESNVIVEHNGHYRDAREDNEANLERNAARMLSSRFNPRCTSHLRGRISVAKSTQRRSFPPEPIVADCTSSHSKALSVDAGKILRTRKRNGDDAVEKRRCFYEVLAKDMDPHWVVTRRIKVFWPLDESWYFGLIKDYNPTTGLHNVKYDDHDEEWINLKSERFKLLMFPSEFKGKFITENNLSVKHNDDAECISTDSFGGTILESEPIISWLARSKHRVKASSLNNLKKKKGSHSNKESVSKYNLVPAKVTELSQSSAVMKEEPILKHNTDPLDRRFSFCYSRRRSRRIRKGLVRESDKYPICSLGSSCFPSTLYLGFVVENVKSIRGIVVSSIAVRNILNFRCAAESYCLYNFIWSHQCGTLVALWPDIHMEVLIVDNATGLRFVSFVGCLVHAINIICLIMSMFGMAGCAYPEELKLPFTTIAFKLSRTEHRSPKFVSCLQFFVQHGKSEWIRLERKLRCHSFSTVPRSECNYPTISKFVARSYLFSHVTLFKEGARKGPLVNLISLEVPRRLRKSAMSILCRSKQDNSLDAFSSAEQTAFLLNWHLKLLIRNAASVVSERYHTMGEHGCLKIYKKFSDDYDPVILESASLDNSDGGSKCYFKVTNAYLHQNTQGSQVFDGQVHAKLLPDHLINTSVSSMQYTSSTASKSTLNDNELIPISPTFGHYSLSDDLFREGSFNGHRKPRTQVLYSLPLDRHYSGSKHQNHFPEEHPCKRIRIENVKRTDSALGSLQHSPSPLACEANILIMEVDKGWRQTGAEVVLQYDDHDWRILVKVAGISRYSFKAHHFMQPGISNRYTHALMWKGGKDWTLEFTHRSQWAIFRELYEECYDRNTRAANIKNIPIPGVRLIEDINMYDDETSFIRSSTYIQHVGNEVDMAMNSTHSFYDMDSDDETWVSKLKYSDGIDGRELSENLEDIFERVIGMLEKLSYSKKCEEFSDAELESFLTESGPVDVIKSIYGYWKMKRQKKQMPLIRQFQPPLWEWYQQQMKNWEMAVNRTANSASGFQEKGSSLEKPPMFAFCLKPRGLDVSNKGPKQRSHKKMMVSVNQSTCTREHDSSLFGRKYNGYLSGCEQMSDTNYRSQTGFSPRNFTSGSFFSRDSPKTAALVNSRSGRLPLLKIPRSNSMRIGPFSSSNKDFLATPTDYDHKTRRSSSCRWSAESQEWFGNDGDGARRHAADIEEFRLRDASSAAKHALNMAKLKREKAQWLLHKADLAIHKAVVALVNAEAMKASEEDMADES